jgi:hypothetical protein
MSAIASRCGRLHCEFVRLLFLQGSTLKVTKTEVLRINLNLWRDIYHFMNLSLIYWSSLYLSLYRFIINKKPRVQFVYSTSDQFHYHRTVFSSQLKSKVGNILTKTAALRIHLNIEDTPVESRSHTHPSHSQTSRLLTSSLSLGVPVPLTTQCICISLLCISRFIVS